MKARISYSTHRAPSEQNYSTQPIHSISGASDIPVKVSELPWQKAGMTYTATGYGKRIPTRYMVQVNGKWRRVYCRIYSNNGTLYIGKLAEYGERAIVYIDED